MSLGNYLRTMVLGASVLLASCSKREERTELSDILHEDAAVSETVYCPSRHGSDVAPTMTSTGNGVSIGATVVTIDIPEKYAVVFKCKYGKFIIEGTDQRHRDLWQRFTQGQEVDVTYREVFKSIYDDTKGTGKVELIEKKLVKYDFLDAVSKKVEAEKK